MLPAAINPTPAVTAAVQATMRSGRSLRRRVVESFTVPPPPRWSFSPMAATPRRLVRFHVATSPRGVPRLSVRRAGETTARPIASCGVSGPFPPRDNCYHDGAGGPNHAGTGVVVPPPHSTRP
jgi:hypothetical protein